MCFNILFQNFCESDVIIKEGFSKNTQIYLSNKILIGLKKIIIFCNRKYCTQKKKKKDRPFVSDLIKKKKSRIPFLLLYLGSF